MSLLRIREFWSLELEQLVAQSSIQDLRSPSAASEVENGVANFVACWGQFGSIGRQEVLVCGHLNGFICIVQVPEDRQLYCRAPDHQQGSMNPRPQQHDLQEKRESRVSAQSETNRQILLGSQLSLPIVDLKCGYFTSTIKQSVAVLSFDCLLVFHVKPYQADLMSLPIAKSAQSDSDFDGNLFSHQLEEQYRINLHSGELANNLLVLSCCPSGSLADGPLAPHCPPVSNLSGMAREKSSASSSSSGNAGRQNAPLLPQRDQLIVQYTNQLTFSLIEYKKVSGHFRVISPSAADKSNDENRDRVESSAQFLGPMPMAYLYESKLTSLLAITLSDHKIRCVLLERLLSQAKQSVVKRVARNLLSDANLINDELASGPVEGQAGSKLGQIVGEAREASHENWIELDLDSISTWQFELAREPLQLQSIRRLTSASNLSTFANTNQRSRLRSGAGTNMANSEKSDTSSSSQLIAMTRYTLDLFSSRGDHIWSQRFEEPLICSLAYTLPPLPVGQPEQKQLTNDRLLIIMCSDCLSSDKCNLSIFEDDNLVWSALLDSKPVQVWRANLEKTSHVLVTLHVNLGKVSVSYLGTNMADINDASKDTNDPSLNPSADFAQLELIDTPLFEADANLPQMDESGALINLNRAVGNESMADSSTARSLKIDTKLEASNRNSEVCVDSCISLRADNDTPASCVVLHNMIVTIEFDELIRYKSLNQTATSISPGVVQIHLGTYWPDKGEPLTLKGTFTFRCNSSAGTGAIDQMDEEEHGCQQWPVDLIDLSLTQTDLTSSSLLPKSLQVTMYVRFSDTKFGPAIQEYSFQLPLNLIGRLIHIDYSSGQNQNLADVLCNLQLYKRTTMILPPDDVEYDNLGGDASPYYVLDLFARISGDIMEIVDEIIESDLVCRGLNIESDSYIIADQQQRRLSTLENINLLAQSLDCRLKFKSQAHSLRDSRHQLRTQSSDELTLSGGAIMISIALKVPSGQCADPGNVGATSESNGSAETIVWLHLVDLGSENSVIPEQFLRQHMCDWYVREPVTTNAIPVADHLSGRPVLLSVECEKIVPALFLHNHLVDRLKRRQMKRGSSFPLPRPFTEREHDSLEINYSNILRLQNFIAISSNLKEALQTAVQFHEKDFKQKFKDTKQTLMDEYCKLHIATTTSISLSKRLTNLPESEHQIFTDLSSLTKQFQMSLLAKLQELEQLKRSDYLFGKFPQINTGFLSRGDSKEIQNDYINLRPAID